MAIASKKLILVVDDLEQDSYAIARVLRHAGYHAFECRDLKSARESLRTRPDAIILDIELPDGSGIEFSSELKRDGATSCIPIILISNHHDLSSDHMRMMESRAETYMSKPIESNSLISVLSGFFA